MTELKELSDPIGKVSMNRQLDSGLILKKISVPIGVIGAGLPAACNAVETLLIHSEYTEIVLQDLLMGTDMDLVLRLVSVQESFMPEDR